MWPGGTTESCQASKVRVGAFTRRSDGVEEDFLVPNIRRQRIADDRDGATRLMLRAAWLQLFTTLVR
ncbi:hypothetical protein GCM10027597_48880 [Saccharopolyspora tripterygii]